MSDLADAVYSAVIPAARGSSFNKTPLPSDRAVARFRAQIVRFLTDLPEEWQEKSVSELLDELKEGET